MFIFRDKKFFFKKKQVVKKIKKKGNWSIRNPAELMEWASTKIVQTKESFLNDNILDSNLLNELIVLHTFENSSEENGIELISHGLVITSRLVFGNIKFINEGQSEENTISTDGTYKLHFGNFIYL